MKDIKEMTVLAILVALVGLMFWLMGSLPAEAQDRANVTISEESTRATRTIGSEFFKVNEWECAKGNTTTGSIVFVICHKNEEAVVRMALECGSGFYKNVTLDEEFTIALTCNEAAPRRVTPKDLKDNTEVM